MGIVAFTYDIQNGQPNDADQVMANLNTLLGLVNGNLDDVNLSAALAAVLGVTQGSTKRRGKTITATAESTGSTSYTTLTTPDEVTNIVLPTDGLLFVAFQALWRETVDGAARAALFLGSNQLKGQKVGDAAPAVQEAEGPGNANIWTPLATGAEGLAGRAGSSNTSSGSDVTTGQVVSYDATTGAPGGACCIFAAAGTYTVGVRFKASSGSVEVKERKLWAWTLGF